MPSLSFCRLLSNSQLTFLIGLAMALGSACTVDSQSIGSPSKSARLMANKPLAVAYDEEWVRLVEDEEGNATGLETAIARYSGKPKGAKGKVLVDLVGAIHVGDAAYYADLNQRFLTYQVLLYELVAPEGTVIPKGSRARSDNAMGLMQNGMKDLLDLEHQLEKVDYTARNFVHADMSPEELLASMKSKGESVISMYFRLMGQAIGEQTKQQVKGKSTELDLMQAMFATEDRPRKLKIAMASQMTELEGLLTSFGGEKGSSLIHERNRVALEVMAEQIKRGKRRLGIFYGAGHLADMDKRLRDQYDMQQISKEWVTAWNLKPAE